MTNPRVLFSEPVDPHLAGLEALGIIDDLLRSRDEFFVEISQGRRLRQKTRAMLVSSAVCLALYGVVLGSSHSLWQSLSAAVKLPLLFLATLLICAPLLFVLNILLGASQRLSQSIAFVLSAINITAVLLLSFVPISLFFIITVPNAYQFFKLLNVLFFVISGGIGLLCLNQGLKAAGVNKTGPVARGRGIMFWLWMITYCFVGSQVAWTLRPFVGFPDAPFELFRQFGGNFYTNILASFGEILGFIIVK